MLQIHILLASKLAPFEDMENLDFFCHYLGNFSAIWSSIDCEDGSKDSPAVLIQDKHLSAEIQNYSAV